MGSRRAIDNARLAAAALLLLLPTLRDAVAAQPAEPPLRDSIAERLDLAHRLTLGSPLHLVVEETLLYTPSPERLERIAAQVARTPEHPDAQRLELWKQRLRGEGEVLRHEIWIGDDQTLRLATTFVGQDRYRDHANGRDGVWSLDPNRLSTAPEGSLARTMSGGIIDGLLNHLVYGSARRIALAADPAIDAEPGSDGVAMVRLSAEGLPSMWWTMSLDPQHGWLLTRAELDPDARSMVADESTTAIDYADHREVSGTGVVLPTLVTLTAKDGQPSREYRVVHLAASSADEIRDLTARPSEDRPDPLRGWAGQTTGSMPVAPAPAVEAVRESSPQADPQRAREGFNTTLVMILLAAAGVAVATAVFLLKRRAG